MASGDTLVVWTARTATFPPGGSNPATLEMINNRPVIAFDQTTQETCYFEAIMPSHYGDEGVDIVIFCGSKVTSGNVQWDISFEVIGHEDTDIDSDAFNTEQTGTATNVPTVQSGHIDNISKSIADGTGTDNVAANDEFRIRIRRNVATDTAAGDCYITKVVMKIT